MAIIVQHNTRYVDEREVSRITGRALPTLRNDRCKKQGIPYIKIGRTVRYCVQDVITFMDSHKIETQEI